MTIKRTPLIIIIAVVAMALGAGWFIYTGMSDDRTREDQPIGQPMGEIEPVLEVVAEDLGQIWGIDFIPDTSRLVATENSGQLFLIDTENLQVTEIEGVMEVDDSGQGGLLDVAVSPDFKENNVLYFTYSAGRNGGRTTYLARAVLDTDNAELRDIEQLFAAEPAQSGSSHYGSRVVIAGKYLYMTIGDRGDKNFDDHVSQDTGNTLGTTIRLKLDGSVPEENPLVGDPDAADEIYSFGHRNAQGMAIHPGTGELWQSEHGEQDGDEINIIKSGANYGWPEAHTGCTYLSGQAIGDLPQDRDDIVDPIHYWPCNSGGFPPAGMTFYHAEGFLNWQGDLFVGGLAGQYLAHFKVLEDGLEEQDPLLKQEGWRVRDVTVGQHDGAIYAAVEGREVSLVRIAPRKTPNNDQD